MLMCRVNPLHNATRQMHNIRHQVTFVSFRTIALVLKSWNSGSAKERVTGNKFEGNMSKVKVYKNVLCRGIQLLYK